MFEYLPQALTSLSAALEIGKGFSKIRDSQKLQEAVMQFNSAIIDAQSKIISAQAEQSSLARQIDELEQECVRLKNWDTEREQYSRIMVAPGVFAYVQNDVVKNFEQAHKYCCNCFDNYQKSTLQQYRVEKGRGKGLTCSKGCPDLLFPYYSEPQ